MGGQTTLRSYWRNYYEQTEGLIWVIDSTDIRRLNDCKAELHKLLCEERLAGATLLLFANKQDISGAQSSEGTFVSKIMNTTTHVRMKVSPSLSVSINTDDICV